MSREENRVFPTRTQRPLFVFVLKNSRNKKPVDTEQYGDTDDYGVVRHRSDQRCRLKAFGKQNLKERNDDYEYKSDVLKRPRQFS